MRTEVVILTLFNLLMLSWNWWLMNKVGALRDTCARLRVLLAMETENSRKLMRLGLGLVVETGTDQEKERARRLLHEMGFAEDIPVKSEAN